MFQINTQLIRKYFLLSDNHNVLYNISDTQNLNIDKITLQNTINYLHQIIDNHKQDSGLYTIDTQDHILMYMVEYLYQTFKIYENKFKTKNDFILFLYINLSLYLTLFSPNALNIIRYANEFLFIDDDTTEILNALVESNDTRGLFFYICDKFQLPYDKFLDKKFIKYEYTAPTINKKWQNKYKKNGQPIVFWFYESMLGKSLFLVLYGPKCRYKTEKGGCSGCNLPTVSSSNTIPNHKDIVEQIDNTFLKQLSNAEKDSIKELILSNNGSILDPKTISQNTLEYVIITIIQHCKNLKKMILETRIDNYSDFEQLKVLYNKVKSINNDIEIELAIGFEIFDDDLRNGYYKKGLDKEVLEKKLKSLTNINVSLKIYLMYKAVPDKYMNIDDSIQDINNASEYFSKLATKYNAKLNLHISPTYLATGTQLYKDFKNGLYTPLTTQDIQKLFKELIIYDNLSYYISMNDEGLADDRLLNESDYNNYLNLSKEIHNFNITQYKC